MCKYQLDHHRILDTCNYLDGTTACVTGRYIDIEYSLEALCPGHRGMLLHRRSLFAVYLAFGALTSFRRRHQGSVLAVWREHAMEACQIGSRPGHQGSKSNHEIQWTISIAKIVPSLSRLFLSTDGGVRGFYKRNGLCRRGKHDRHSGRYGGSSALLPKMPGISSLMGCDWLGWVWYLWLGLFIN